MATNIATIEKICGNIKNKKGVKAYIAVVEECGVISIPDPIAYDATDPATHHSINGNIELKDNYNWVVWNGRKKDADFSFEDDGEQDEEIVKIAGNLYIPRISGFKTYMTNQTRGTEFLILMWDENDPVPRLLGEITNGCTIKVKEQFNPKNGYILTVAGEVTEKPFYYRGNIDYGS